MGLYGNSREFTKSLAGQLLASYKQQPCLLAWSTSLPAPFRAVSTQAISQTVLRCRPQSELVSLRIRTNVKFSLQQQIYSPSKRARSKCNTQPANMLFRSWCVCLCMCFVLNTYAHDHHYQQQQQQQQQRYDRTDGSTTAMAITFTTTTTHTFWFDLSCFFLFFCFLLVCSPLRLSAAPKLKLNITS